MSYFSFRYSWPPEPFLDPPEDPRDLIAECTICDDPIYEGEEHFDIPGFGYCCARCVEDSRRNGG